MLKAACWVGAIVLVAGGVLFVLPFIFTSTCKSSPMMEAFISLREIELAEQEVRKGSLGAENPGGPGAFWRKDIRALESITVNGNVQTLVSHQVAASDIGGIEGKVILPNREISLRALNFLGEPPIDYSKYAVVMWVHERGGLGWWTLVASQDGVWGKPQKLELETFPVDLPGNGWLPADEVKCVVTASNRWGRWRNFWGIGHEVP
jgi:hypothetical protein